MERLLLICILEDMLIKDASDQMDASVHCTYPRIREGLSDNSYFQDREILAPTYKIIDKVNEYYHFFQEKRGCT